ncbi:phage SPO1 DNA polymerase-related protein [Thermodesulfobium narugense DSM 14796]|uniref:Type-4 uracil-DNA glycosylase n=1 Tax=Thermodesulfobium narugense DSM 14796 TaxID=747365 RepID=M1E4Q4_9BACT|nr:uracil-DNA glycosylase [Thermodesulfobium narugense]AEE14407.1 phage SPO1 DNA polymerase-related protein [Thermodesulfobium narugense DSM 14796]
MYIPSLFDNLEEENKQKENSSKLKLSDILIEAKNCKKCKLSETRINVVFGEGPMNPDIMVIGEGPGETEDIQGLPFVGKAGQLLTKIFESVSLNRKDIYITNVVKCRPPGNRNPLPEEIEQCRPFLDAQIKILNPKIIILLGAVACKTILKNFSSITKIRGEIILQDNRYYIPMFHPSYLLRNASRSIGSPRWLTWKDIQKVKQFIEEN